MKKFSITFLLLFTVGAAHAANNCTGATYYDSTNDTCIACPTGYDANTDAGKTSINQCQIHCDAGTYINGVNLFDMGKIPERNDAAGTIVRNVDGSITVTTTPGNGSVNTNRTLSQLAPSLEVGETYILGIDTSGSSKYIYLSPAAMSWTNNGVKTITQAMLDSKVLLYASGTSTSATISNIQIESGTVLTVGAGKCVDVGAGYWAAASTTNFGSIGTRNACPIGTYSSAVNGTSLSSCLDCTGATYNDETAAAICKACPTGYIHNTTAGKTSVNQCQIYCDGGTYVRVDSINLLDDSFINNSTYGDVTVNGVTTNRAKILPTENGKTYTLSATLIPTGTYFYYLKEINPDGTVLNQQCSSMWNNYNQTNDTVKRTCTFTARNNATYLVYFATSTSPNVLTLMDYQMSEGLTADKTYNSVPAGYTPLEYIEFNGAQYIDTGVVLTNASNMELVMEMQSNTADDFQTWAGFKNLSGANIRYEVDFYNNKWMVGVRTTDAVSSVATDTGAHTIKFDTYSNAPKLYEGNGTLLISTSVSSTTLTDNTLSLYIGARNDDGSPANFVNGRIGRTYLVKERKKLYDYIPALRNSDNVVGMYDTISNTFFTNDGAGNFTAGPAISGLCSGVWPGYYSSAQTVNYGSAGTRTACPAGTTTVGYGHGADSANDCGRTLHVGDNVLYMRKNKETSPALHIQMENGDMFYVNLSPTNHNMSKMHLWHNGTKYTAYDDSLFYNERDFVTNSPITP